MTYKPDPDKLGIDISFCASAFVLMVIAVVLLTLPLVSDLYIGLVLMAVVMVLVALIPTIRRLALRHLYGRYFGQSLEIDEELVIYRGPHGAVTTSIPVSVIDVERTQITPKKALILYSTTDGVVQAISIPLYLYDREAFEVLNQIVPHIGQ